MLKVSIFGKIFLFFLCFISVGHSNEHDTDWTGKRSKQYKRLKAEVHAPFHKKKTKKKSKTPLIQNIPEKPAELPYFIFPDQIEALNTAIHSGPTNLSIYISKRIPAPGIGSFSVGNPDELENLETLTLYHFIPKHLYHNPKTVQPFIHLLNAPNLRKVTFTHLLAKALLPLISPEVEIVFDFQSRHITDPVMPAYTVKEYRKAALDWLKEYPDHKIVIPDVQ